MENSSAAGTFIIIPDHSGRPANGITEFSFEQELLARLDPQQQAEFISLNPLKW
jgi:hypothetical protein